MKEKKSVVVKPAILNSVKTFATSSNVATATKHVDQKENQQLKLADVAKSANMTKDVAKKEKVTGANQEKKINETLKSVINDLKKTETQNVEKKADLVKKEVENKTETRKAEAKKVEAKKTEAKKAEAKKAETKRTDSKKSTTQKTTTKKTEVKKPIESKKTVVPKKAEETVKVVEKKKDVSTSASKELILQYGNLEVTSSDIYLKVISAYVADGNKEADINDIKIYIKPEENMAYYVINQEYKSSVTLS